MMVSKFGISFSRDFFSGSMLNFRGVKCWILIDVSKGDVDGDV